MRKLGESQILPLSSPIMVPMRRFLPALAALLLMPAALAQEADGCVRTDPCPWTLEVTEDGFRQQMPNGTYIALNYQTEFTVGDWVEIILFSSDANASHTITLSGHEVSIRVGPDGYATDTGAFQLKTAGTFTLRDQPSGDELQIHVREEDTGSSSRSGSKDEGAPGPGILLAAGALALAFLARRRA